MSAPSALFLFNYSRVLPAAFHAAGWNVASCDLLPAEHEFPHHQCDWRQCPVQGVHLVIACPPCTFLSKAGADKWKDRQSQISQAYQTVLDVWALPVQALSLENPVGWLNTNWTAPSQIVQPYQFGDPYWKQTCFWLRGLPPLISTRSIMPRQRWLNKFHHGRPSARHRSRFFPGIAQAMAEQWTPQYLGL